MIGTWSRAWGDSWGLSWGLTYEANQDDLLANGGGPDSINGPRTWRDDDDREHDKAFARYRDSIYKTVPQPIEALPVVIEGNQVVPAAPVIREPVASIQTIDLSPASEILADANQAISDITTAVNEARQRKADEEALILMLLD